MHVLFDIVDPQVYNVSHNYPFVFDTVYLPNKLIKSSALLLLSSIERRSAFLVIDSIADKTKEVVLKYGIGDSPIFAVSTSSVLFLQKYFLHFRCSPKI